jgi:hypothetical protein
MKRFYLIMMLVVPLAACQKQQSDEERRAEVDRQVQERLATEHQQQQAQELSQREAALSAREQALKDTETVAATATSAPEPQITSQTTTEREPENSYSTFYTKLEPYGDWIQTDEYGYVYHPREAENVRWRPYTQGHWVYTDAGWTWISDEPFGWATYHYGRWTRIRGAGWVWVPGNEWAPAWVSWRKGGQYVGWAPLPPEARFDRGSGIGNWSDNYYDVGPDQYVFVAAPDLGEQQIERAIVPEQQNVTIVNQTTNVTKITYNKTVIVNQGPSYEELGAHSRVPVQRLRLQREAGVPGDNARAVVHGDSVAIPAPVIAPARATERPRTVKQTITQAPADRGWSAIANQREAEQARAKMKSEATPPPNAPPKKFTKPAAAPNTTPAPTVRVVTTPNSAAKPAKARPARTAAAMPIHSPTAPQPSTPLPTHIPPPVASPAVSPATTTPVPAPPQNNALERNPPIAPRASASPTSAARATASPVSQSPTNETAPPSVPPHEDAAAQRPRAERKRPFSQRRAPAEVTATPSPPSH